MAAGNLSIIPEPARWWKKESNGTILCQLCPRGCLLSEGQKGYCRVRLVKDGALVTFVYGYASGFQVDPIEKKPLYHFLPGSRTFSFGTASCNLGCIFCQNWGITKGDAETVLTAQAKPEEIADAARRHNCLSVSFTYNEPVISAEYTIDTAEHCHALGVKTVAVTSGYISEVARSDFFAEIDAANVDLKGFSEDFYKTYCNASLAPVLDTLEHIVAKTSTWLEITNLIIPGANDSESEIDAMTKWIAQKLGRDVPLHFSAFHPDFRLTDRDATSPQTLFRARDIATANGLKFVYLGNIRSPRGGDTCCPNCHNLLVERSGFRVLSSHLENGTCGQCQTKIAGIF